MRPIRPILSVLALLGATGCTSLTGVGPAAQALPAATKPNAFDRIVNGMSAAQVHDLVGKPHVVIPIKHEEVTAETWLYLRKVDEAVRPVPIGVREVPAINPITGQSIIIEEPIMRDDFTTLYEDFRLLLVDGHVVAINRRQRIEREVH